MEMAKAKAKTCVMAMLIVSAMMSSHGNGEAVTCQEAVISLIPCAIYLSGPAVQPSTSCCLAVAQLNQKADSTPIRRSLCECFKGAAISLGTNVAKAKQLPDLCHVHAPAPIDPNVDCNSIQ